MLLQCNCPTAASGVPIVPQRKRLGAPTVAQVLAASLVCRSGVSHLSVQAFALKEAQEGCSFCLSKVAAFRAVERMVAVLA